MRFRIIDADDRHDIMGGEIEANNAAFSWCVPESSDGPQHHTQIKEGKSMRVRLRASGMNQRAIVVRTD